MERSDKMSGKVFLWIEDKFDNQQVVMERKLLKQQASSWM